MPAFGTWHKIIGIVGATGSSPAITVEVLLEVYPDANMGAGTSVLIYHFGVYRIASHSWANRPFCYQRKSASFKHQRTELPLGGTTDLDIIFAPSGELVGASTGANAYANGQLFLWVRNYTNAAIPQAPDGTLAQGPNL